MGDDDPEAEFFDRIDNTDGGSKNDDGFEIDDDLRTRISLQRLLWAGLRTTSTMRLAEV